MEKKKFMPRYDLFLALGLLFDEQPPELYLIPSRVWAEPTGIFVSRDYEGLKSKPGWVLNISKKNMPALELYRFEVTVARSIEEAANNQLCATGSADM
jgi:hypothetical protein